MDPERHVDVIVVGAGSSGVTTAVRLAQGGARVVLIEAGGWVESNPAVEDPSRWSELIGSSLDWGYGTEPSRDVNEVSMPWPRGKAVGGSSVINGMIYLRGGRPDWDSWAAYGVGGWSYDDVLPFFLKSEDWNGPPSQYHGIGGELRTSFDRAPSLAAFAFLDAAVDAGFARNDDFNGAHHLGAGLLPHTIRDGRRESVASAFLSGGAPDGLEILTQALATRILFHGTRCYGIEIVRDGRVESIEANEVVLSAGAVESPKLLLLSGIGPADELRRIGVPVLMDLPVGRNLQDHVAVAVSVASEVDLKIDNRSPHGEASLFLHAVSTDSALPPDLQFHVAPMSGRALGRFAEPPAYAYSLLPTLVQPASRGSLTLRSADPAVPPRIEPNYLSEELDREVLRHGIMLSQELVESSALSSLGRSLVLPSQPLHGNEELDDHIARTLMTFYHPVGTCRMGSREDAVVNDELQVLGIDGLRVADASVMPMITSVNTNAPCIMIGERAATFLLDRS